MADLTTYSYKNVAATLDNRPVSGVWEGDDCVVVARRTDVVTPVTGADGKSVVSLSADETAEITLRLMHTSPTHQRLRTYQRAGSLTGSARVFPFSVRDTESNEGGVAAECVILQAPEVQHGDAATVREWRLFAGAFIWNEVTYEG